MMKSLKKLHLDHGQPTIKQSPWALMLLITGLIVAAIVIVSLQQTGKQISQLELEMSQAQRPRISSDILSLQGKENSTKRDELIAVQGAIVELKLPWDELFNMLESLKMPQVRLLTIEPNPKQHKLRLTAESASTEDMFDYVAALTKQPLLSHVFLLTHERSEDGRELPIGFVIEATWKR
jgi:Tfp pilus assembly protein PilN